jgi:hypothetical protein
MAIQRRSILKASVTIPIAALLAMVWTPVSAGEVYGKITMKGASVGEGTSVSARCAKKSYPPTSTDKSGTFHLIIGETGKCTLNIGYKSQTADLDMMSYDDEVQYDIALEMKDNKLTARRR